jgi:hypothetical protein
MTLTGPQDASTKGSAHAASPGLNERLPGYFSSPDSGWLSVLSAPPRVSPLFWRLPRASSYVHAMRCFRIVGAERDYYAWTRNAT